MIPAENVVMGVPKKGRLYDRCMKLLAGAGMDHRRVSSLVTFRNQTSGPTSGTNDKYPFIRHYGTRPFYPPPETSAASPAFSEQLRALDIHALRLLCRFVWCVDDAPLDPLLSQVSVRVSK